MADQGSFEVGSERTRLHFAWRFHGEDLHLHIDGGADHIGAVALASATQEGGAEVRLLRIMPHREDELVRGVAARLHEATASTVCVTAGVHLQNAVPREIQEIIKNSAAGVMQLMQLIERRRVTLSEGSG